jgi:hypothetical protein
MNRSILTCLLVLGLLAVSVMAAAGEDTSVVTGESWIGAHYVETSNHFDKVGEYVSDANAGEFQGHGFFKLNGATDGALFDMFGFYRDRDTKAFGLDLKTDGKMDASFGYQSFIHRMDHDLLLNMEAREALADGTPGGKQVYTHDMDPMGRYWLEYEKLEAGVTYDLSNIENGKIYARYVDQHKNGWKQSLTLDHCATCHVESNRDQISEQTTTMVVGAEGTMSGVTFNYEFQAQDFTDHSEANSRRWTRAAHPGRGGTWPATDPTSNYVVEFGSRLSFHDVALPYQVGATTEKRSHEFGLKADINDKNQVKGSYSHARVDNIGNQLSSDFDAYAAGWIARPNKKTRITARALIYEVKADDAYIDLLPYRDERPGGGQDFDWTRISAANREVLQADLAFRYRLAKGTNLGLTWRHKTVDRPAMNQTQTTYANVDGLDVLTPSTAIANETTTDRLRMNLSKRFGRKGNAKLTYTFTQVDQQFMNSYGICEEAMNGTNYNLADNGVTYYFQRERVGNATSLPTKSHRVAMRGSWRFSPKVSLNAYVNVADEKNDEMNSYEFSRTMFSPGANLWIAPSDKMMLTMGYSFNSVESNAKICPPLFGG